MEDKYEIIFFQKNNCKKPVFEYLENIPPKDSSKIIDFIEKISIYSEFRREPFSRQLDRKLRELKVDFSSNRHRIIYFFNVSKTIILLNAFTKKTSKTPIKEIKKAKKYMQEYLNNIV